MVMIVVMVMGVRLSGWAPIHSSRIPIYIYKGFMSMGMNRAFGGTK